MQNTMLCILCGHNTHVCTILICNKENNKKKRNKDEQKPLFLAWKVKSQCYRSIISWKQRESNQPIFRFYEFTEKNLVKIKVAKSVNSFVNIWRKTRKTWNFSCNARICRNILVKMKEVKFWLFLSIFHKIISPDFLKSIFLATINRFQVYFWVRQNTIFLFFNFSNWHLSFNDDNTQIPIISMVVVPITLLTSFPVRCR